MMVIRAMSKAKYSSQNIGHFGLKFENYSHFTSPIRRYARLNGSQNTFFYFKGKVPRQRY